MYYNIKKQILDLIETIREMQNHFLKFPTDIEKYKGCSLWIPREEGQELGENEYYIADLLGMKVVLEDGTEFGTLKNVMETGANDVYVIASRDHGEVLLPAIRQCILDVDVKNGIMTVNLMKGLI